MKHEYDDDEIPAFRRDEIIDGDLSPSLDLITCQNCGHEHEGGPCPVCNHINEADEDDFD